jgi:hypothetical protein
MIFSGVVFSKFDYFLSCSDCLWNFTNQINKTLEHPKILMVKNICDQS